MSGSDSNSNSAWTEPPWSGFIESTGDALLILEAARRGLIPRVTRRLVDAERKMITSGSVFVFDEDESGIKRWTDGFFWSPSRILGNFLLYRETEKRGAGHRSARSDQAEEQESSKTDQSLSRPKGESTRMGVDRQRERSLVGSLTNSYKFKPGGMMKKVRYSFPVAVFFPHYSYVYGRPRRPLFAGGALHKAYASTRCVSAIPQPQQGPILGWALAIVSLPRLPRLHPRELMIWGWTCLCFWLLWSGRVQVQSPGDVLRRCSDRVHNANPRPAADRVAFDHSCARQRASTSHRITDYSRTVIRLQRLR